MKTKLLTICLLLITSQVFADCHDDLRGSTFKRWDDFHDNPTLIFVRFKNSSKNTIKIHSYGFFASDNKTVMKENITNSTVVEPFSILPGLLEIKMLNMDVQGKYFISCSYK